MRLQDGIGLEQACIIFLIAVSLRRALPLGRVALRDSVPSWAINSLKMWRAKPSTPAVSRTAYVTKMINSDVISTSNTQTHFEQVLPGLDVFFIQLQQPAVGQEHSEHGIWLCS